MKRVYRIYTEDKGERQTQKLALHLVENYFPAGITITRGIGYWNGIREKSLTIMVATESDYAYVANAAHWIIGYLEQEAVGIEHDGVFELEYDRLVGEKEKARAELL